MCACIKKQDVSVIMCVVCVLERERERQTEKQSLEGLCKFALIKRFFGRSVWALPLAYIQHSCLCVCVCVFWATWHKAWYKPFGFRDEREKESWCFPDPGTAGV